MSTQRSAKRRPPVSSQSADELRCELKGPENEPPEMADAAADLFGFVLGHIRRKRRQKDENESDKRNAAA